MSEVVWRNGTTGLSDLSCCSLHELSCGLSCLLSWAPPGIVPLLSRCAGWRRRWMPLLVWPERNRRELLFSRLLAKLKSERFLIGPNFPDLLREINSFRIETTHLPSFDRWSLSARPRPSGCGLLQFDQCWFEIHEMWNLTGSDRESLQILSWCISFLDYGRCSGLLLLTLPKTMAMKSPFLNDIVRDWEKFQCPSEATSAGLILFQEMPASAVDDASIPVKKAFFALHFRNCLAQLK